MLEYMILMKNNKIKFVTTIMIYGEITRCCFVFSPPVTQPNNKQVLRINIGGFENDGTGEFLENVICFTPTSFTYILMLIACRFYYSYENK